MAQRIQAIAQNGLAYSTNPYDVERYSELSAIAASMSAGPEPERIVLAAGLFAASHGYATPKVDVRAAVFQDSRVLLVRGRKTGAGPCLGDGLKADKAPRNPSNARCMRSLAMSSRR